MPQQLWQVRTIDLGRTTVDHILEDGTRLRLEVFDGGGFARSHGVWRLGRSVFAIMSAGEA